MCDVTDGHFSFYLQVSDKIAFDGFKFEFQVNNEPFHATVNMVNHLKYERYSSSEIIIKDIDLLVATLKNTIDDAEKCPQ